MEFIILGKPDYTCVKCRLSAGESIVAESGAMVAMSQGIEIETGARGGILQSAKRSLLGGETFFINTYTCTAGNGEVIFAPPQTGDLEHIVLSGNEIVLSTGAFICSTSGVNMDSTWGGFKALFAGEGLFFLKASGIGDLFFSSFGAIHRVDVDDEYIVDTGHLVAFDPSLDYSITKVGGLKSLFLSGEGLVCRFRGKGSVYIQTRNQNSFTAWADQFRRIERNR